VGERSSGGVAHAVKDGIARAASAPAVFAGTLALTFAFALSKSLGTLFVLFDQRMAVILVSPFGGAMYQPQGMPLSWFIVWSFLTGGILDRYARHRPTRGRGFFGACGAHFPAMLRLGIAEWLVWIAAGRFDLEQYPGSVALVVALAASLVFLYARVRLVVEDRRSVLGALLAGGRFIRRNPAAVSIFLVFAAGIWIADGLWGRLPPPGDRLPVYTAAELLVTLLMFLVFASWASAVSFFQSRLAHAAYTAGPPLEWPESPAAEAIANLVPTRRP
jgi:hypothetical protein